VVRKNRLLELEWLVIADQQLSQQLLLLQVERNLGIVRFQRPLLLTRMLFRRGYVLALSQRDKQGERPGHVLMVPRFRIVQRICGYRVGLGEK
jgi:hypothetical protein